MSAGGGAREAFVAALEAVQDASCGIGMAVSAVKVREYEDSRKQAETELVAAYDALAQRVATAERERDEAREIALGQVADVAVARSAAGQARERTRRLAEALRWAIALVKPSTPGYEEARAALLACQFDADKGET